MFDDLHDPHPPVAEMKTLADVTERARGIRRRRAVFGGGAAALLVVAATIGTLAALRDDDSQSIVNVSPGPSSVDAGADTSVDPNASTTSTLPSTAVVPSTVAVNPGVSTTAPVPETVVPATVLPVTAVPTTVLPVTVVPETGTITTIEPDPTTTTTAVPVTPRPIVAIDGAGDAVLVELDGTTTVIEEGPDPDDPPPAEGDTYDIDGVAVTPNRSVALVGTCCEPIPGTVLRFALPNVVDSTFAYGHAPTISPDGSKFVTDVLGSLTVRDMDLGMMATTSEDFLTGSGNGFVWLSNERFVVFEAGDNHMRLQSVTLTADGTLEPGATFDTDEVDGFAASFAGTGPGVLYVRFAQDSLSAYDAVTLQRVPSADVALPGRALSAWLENGELRWVGEDRVLHIGDSVIQGEFIWVR